MPDPDKPELVVLIHGIGSHRLFLTPLARRLRKLGFATHLHSYFTLWGSIRHKGRLFAAELRRLAATGKYGKIHVAAHSMGAIVTRCALEEELPDELGRVVMIGPPNRGSHAARRLKSIYGPISTTLVELLDTPDSFVNQLPGAPAGIEIGVLATSRDRVVDLPSTHLDGQRDHRVITGMHTAALWTTECAEQTAHFLRHGAFVPAAELAKSSAGN